MLRNEAISAFFLLDKKTRKGYNYNICYRTYVMKGKSDATESKIYQGRDPRHRL